ncbi:protein EMBRYO SAC DEVELOPMENT ARREST 30-like isoform X3 [Dendrobium catenatum]|uniref:protein EMBRYO SAC DEVELOPMENT ARREST 30-like isoform X3 n=1 Tax=Dendrobium catenatum TaxID=906689 RepID=UPI0010A06116|nr:protein EMBRYO SAC DEVELOPMENT ARREST 30-like isoform X3 [Dendrobium catenatum]
MEFTRLVRSLDIESCGALCNLWKLCNHVLILETFIQICDLVAVSRMLNATLIIPEIQESLQSKGISSKFKSFSYVYNEEQFIAALSNDVVILKSLPDNLKRERKMKKYPTFSIRYSASPSFYINEVLPKLKLSKVVGLLIADGGCLESILPKDMGEYQRLRCRVAFHALQFRPEIRAVGNLMVARLRASGRPYLAFHPGLTRDVLAFHGCSELFQDVHAEILQYRRKQMIKHGIIHGNLSMDSMAQKRKGLCPLMPEEVGLLLRAMGYPSDTVIYLAGAETFGGQRTLIPLRAMYPNLVDRTLLCSKKELSILLGSESPIPSHLPNPPPQRTKEQLIREWNRAGPRPRPLPPPPARPFYQHEKEGWYGWIAENETEPEPSLMDMRVQAHKMIWNAIDYFVSVEADVFFPGFHDDGSGWPDFSSLVMGHRLYQMSASRTFRPDRKTIVNLLDKIKDKQYHPKQNWTILVRQHLNDSLGIKGLIFAAEKSKPNSFISHPLPECSCRAASKPSEVPNPVIGSGGRILYGDEETCPDWLSRGLQLVVPDSTDMKDESEDLPELEPYFGQQEQDSGDGNSGEMSRHSEQDEEMDPED